MVEYMKLRHFLVPLVALIAIGLSAPKLWPHGIKHTGRCVRSFRSPSDTRCDWFVRPNNEIFEACWDNPPDFVDGLTFEDISYKDDNADLRHFIKAKLKAAK